VNNLNRRDFIKLGTAAAMAAALSKIVPVAFAQADVSGKFLQWHVPAETPIDIANLASFQEYVKLALPKVNITWEFLSYADMLDKLRVAVRGGGGPNLAVLPILWGVEFAAGGFLRPLIPEDVGMTAKNFWPKALNSNLWKGQTYGLPTNNETMAFIYNKTTFEKAGLDPDKPPATWQEVAEFSKQIKAKTGSNGFGMVARLNHGNTPFRFMPVMWAYGGSVMDETEDNPKFEEVRINSPETRAALQLYYDMYVTDQSVPLSSLDNSQTETRELFLARQVAMMISHPSEFAVLTEADPTMATEVSYVQYPAGPKRRAAVFGGSNIHIFKNIAEADVKAALEYTKIRLNPEWSNRLAWFSNPGNLQGFDDPYFELRKSQVKFLEVGTSMLEFGVPFPVIPEATEIMNLIVPTMIHNVLTKTLSIDAAVVDAEKKIKDVLARRQS
jgi:multiple sugar transport system substrate-binding protein